MKKRVKAIIYFVDIFILIISPLMIIMFLVGCFSLLTNMEEHRRFVYNLEREGIVAAAEVRLVDEEDRSIVFGLTKPDGTEEFIVMETQYYDAALLSQLERGTITKILYTPPYGSEAALFDAFDQVKGSFQHLLDPLLVLGISWILLVIHPDVLFAGYIDLTKSLELPS